MDRYSFGAAVIAESFRLLNEKPACMMFMEPSPVFHYPAWALFLIRYFGVPFYRILLPFAKWYLRNFRIDTREDNEMAVISSRSLDNSDPRKLRKIILAISGYTIWERLRMINRPSLVVAATKDRLHIHSEIMRITSELYDCIYTDLETNLRTHSSEMAGVIREYLKRFH